MQRLVGIIAEYNPFHNGHKYQIEKTRELLGEGSLIAVVMSGSFVQRGEMASCSKWHRAAMALENGADLIAELPVEYALASANIFARAGVHILNQLGAEYISFGSESGDISMLSSIAECSLNSERSLELSAALKKGISYPNALHSAVLNLYGEPAASLLSSANNLLGIEYIKAIKTLNLGIKPITIRREQAEHDSAEAGSTIASASYIRSKLISGSSSDILELSRYLPDHAFQLLADIKPAASTLILERIFISKLRQMTPSQLSKIADVSEGLENRLYEAVTTAKSLEELYSTVKSKRYTHARIRRIVHNAYLNITAEMQSELPCYARILGTTRRGFEILSRIKQRQPEHGSRFIIDSKFSRLYEQCAANPVSLRSINANIISTDTFAICEPIPSPARQDFTSKFIIV